MQGEKLFFFLYDVQHMSGPLKTYTILWGTCTLNIIFDIKS